LGYGKGEGVELIVIQFKAAKVLGFSKVFIGKKIRGVHI